MKRIAILLAFSLLPALWNPVAAQAPEITKLGSAQGWEAFTNAAHRPGEKRTNEVSFTAGYLFKEGSDADLAIDGKSFSLFTNKEGAWTRDAATDKAVVDALAKGKQAVIKGTSARGTATTDTYSLAGFAQTLAQIDKACGVKR
jgi:hypothetical protein